MRSLKKITALLLLLLQSTWLFAQEGQPEMADQMRSNGRIYVVVAVVVTILIGLILYMVRVDRKLTRIEKEK